MRDIIINLLASAIWFVLGILSIRLIILYRFKIKNLWQIFDPKELVIIAANSATKSTGEYKRPMTGIGQVRAIATIMESLNKAYGNLSIKNIYLSTDQLHDRLENDLILLGGPKNNQITAKFLDSISNYQPSKQTESRIFWKNNKNTKEFYGIVKNEKVITDYGLIIRSKNPFTSKDRTVIVFSGSHTYGTLAAAKYFVENIYKEFGFKILRKKFNIVALISAEVLDDYPLNIKFEEFAKWERK